ncbi:hypothetical protein TCAL_06044 [Tigriopus californicus]|uniref:N-acetyltransferase domain-containing protein n=1 Tax=Tigriopus californicus TaxID=6832 RepID=A0A553PQC9_TIGCA|nr:uncharacterized protein LOC131882476 [Tigriopus californicus]TRY79871.1 hypothetical protein TCAL_06044 [Tigriopus californicus]|eukprot:TCALIF_06044-PA protein Name:"Similar to yhhY Uncharacterized N-acetyltransferase YhhY (Escherichia coli (strain K12))" AED:0.00 eAED:0.00 QI:65/1/1/1/0/0.5/2/373/168
MDVFIGPAVASDAQDIVDYANETGGETDFYSFGADGYPMTVVEQVKEIQDLERTKSIILVGRDSNTMKMVCWGTCHCQGLRSSHVYDLGISVRKSHWSRGIGSLMMNMLIETCRLKGVKKISLTVTADNSKAIGLYERKGFVFEGRRVRHSRIGDEFKDIIDMALFLE